MRKWSGAFSVLVIANAVVSFAAWGQRSTAQAYKNSAGIFADSVSSDSAASSNVAIQDNAAPKESYDVVVSQCSFMAAAGSSDIPLANGVSGSSGVLWYYTAHGLPIPNKIPTTWVTTLKDAPLHGTLIPSQQYSGDFIYQPDEGYTGIDRIVFIVDANGKNFKYIQNIYVTKGAPDALKGPELMKACPDVPVIKETTPNKSSSSSSVTINGWNYMELPALGDVADNQLVDLHQALALLITNDELVPEVTNAASSISPLNYQLKNVNISLNIANLPSGEVGQTTGTSITLDDNGGGYGWFIDSTPQDNSAGNPARQQCGKSVPGRGLVGL